MNKSETIYNESELVGELRKQVISLQIQLDVERKRTKTLTGGTLLHSEAIDFYPGEQLDFVLCMLEQAKERCQTDSRAYDIIESLLSVNQPVGRGKEILEDVTRIFKRGMPERESDIAELQRLGFTYTPSRKHPKLRFHGKYMFILPGTSGDWRCASRNSLSEISKCIAISQKI